MKLTVKAEYLKYLILGAGGLGLALQVLLYATGIDGRGLLVEGHWAQIALLILTALTGILLLLRCRSISGPKKHRSCYPPSVAAAVGSGLLAIAVLICAVSEFSLEDRIEQTDSLVGIAAGLSLAVLAFFRLRGKRPTALFHGLVAMFFICRMIRQYNLWCIDPQLQDYAFLLSSYAALMLSAYHHAEFDAGMGKHKRLWFFSLAAVFLCCVALQSGADTWLLLSGGIWAFTNMTNLTVRSRRAPEAPAEAGSEE